MAEIRSQDKRDKLRLIFAQCAPEKSLQALLLAGLATCDAAINGPTPGTWLASSQEAGGGSSFQMLHDFSPIIAKRMMGELCDAYDLASAAILSNTGAAGTDAQIYQQMMTVNLRSVRKFRSDFTGGRYGIGYFLGQ